ncbi:unnamed protein product [Onchocerca flexuosa]|uniref:Uncharacterized protein n=1 Tax=Onchocerca flexuosa TaxID=387005 RepID=A0A183HMZ8_9BILA|nr:unnamed protein product [Onchocerca flexuosa]
MIGYRMIILFLTTICLSMMMANMLTFNFCIICMTADNYDYLEGNIKMDKLNGNLKSGNYSNQSMQYAIKIFITNKLQSSDQQHKQFDNNSLQN